MKSKCGCEVHPDMTQCDSDFELFGHFKLPRVDVPSHIRHIYFHQCHSEVRRRFSPDRTRFGELDHHTDLGHGHLIQLIGAGHHTSVYVRHLTVYYHRILVMNQHFHHPNHHLHDHVHCHVVWHHCPSGHMEGHT